MGSMACAWSMGSILDTSLVLHLWLALKENLIKFTFSPCERSFYTDFKNSLKSPARYKRPTFRGLNFREMTIKKIKFVWEKVA
jgi:hypothetical protein